MNFGFTTQWDRKAQAYRGQLLVQNNDRWRLRGQINAYAQTSASTGQATGAASVLWWNQALNDTLGGWEPLQLDLPFVINFSDTGNTLTKKRNGAKPDTFALTLLGLDAIDPAILQQVGQPPVCAAAQELKGGNVTIHAK